MRRKGVPLRRDDQKGDMTDDELLGHIRRIRKAGYGEINVVIKEGAIRDVKLTESIRAG